MVKLDLVISAEIKFQEIDFVDVKSKTLKSWLQILCAWVRLDGKIILRWLFKKGGFLAKRSPTVCGVLFFRTIKKLEFELSVLGIDA